jgi:hypothetical protein
MTLPVQNRSAGVKPAHAGWDIVFSMMTNVPETALWLEVASIFAESGYTVGFLLFDESAMKAVTARGFDAFSVFELMDRQPLERMDRATEQEWLSQFGITNVRHLYLHEKLGYGRPDETLLHTKTLHMLQVADRFFATHRAGCLVQETGGFAAINAIFYGATKHGVPHVFYEPSPFAKRVVFTLNGFYANIDIGIQNRTPSPESLAEAKALRDSYLSKPAYVIPSKDKHSFRDMTIGRMFNAFNAQPLFDKLYRKYIAKQREEFSEVGFVVRKNLLKLSRRALQANLYVDPPTNGKPYIYYPFHVPHDVQLSVRSKLFYTQEAFVDYLCRILPEGYDLYVKEHPASIGGHPVSLLRRLLRTHQNLKLIHPRHSSFGLVRDAACVVTVNSKVGFEAVMQGQRVVVVGEAFYKGKGVTFDVDNVATLERTLPEVLTSPPPSNDAILRFMAQVYDWSYPCDLFTISPENIAASAASLKRYLLARQLLPKRAAVAGTHG